MPTDNDFIKDIIKDIKQQYIVWLRSIQPQCEQIFRDAIQIALYDYYPNPVKYERNYDLLKSVDSLVVEDTLYIYINYDFLSYESAVTYGTGVGEDVSFDVPWFLTNNVGGLYGSNGHHDGRGSGQYHAYEKRRYLELAQQMIKDSFDIDVIIINNQDDYDF
jgi:hypothetical protein